MSIMYKVCKRTIRRGNYPKDMIARIEVFYKAELIDTIEYNTLITMISE